MFDPASFMAGFVSALLVAIIIASTFRDPPAFP